MSAEKDYYKVLGVPKNAKQEQIKKAFRKIARDNHPDQHPGDKAAEQRFKEASEAHDVLSDPKKRKKYDAERTMPPGGFHFPGGGSRTTTFTGNIDDVLKGFGGADGLGDIFGGLFNAGGRKPTTPQKGADVEGTVTIDFMDAVKGATVSVKVSGQHACSTCRGTGTKAGTQPKVCPSCQGAGMKNQGGMRMTCTECGGRGLVVDEPCPDCRGTGRSNSHRNVNVRLPEGVSDGQRVRIRERGGAGSNGGPNGDLYVKVKVREHPVFGRDGKNLTITVPVTFSEAALGAEIDVPTLEGGTVKLRLPAGTPNGRVLRVRGRGIKPAKKSAGDLLVKIEVQVPSFLDDNAKEKLREFDRAANQLNPRTRLLGDN
ncbi:MULTISPECIES: molecular chaperone DnaJ [Propionimicrobium]|uniref:Chaperone protein DnaJ n=1 Tax=Propionimicrobium lymphophilum ACS-093-V-SCH5 TaxID=883161 RepID=S2WLM7_9ACTN|nr:MULTISPECIES: molecular chaperone DnaJ [Propionimicrobium]EPD33572.1 chaperone DnaJ [Propionimicrobium lymphophilum ACS-093-V-SCH5]ETJ97555.1 chaperone protein DnaJ [Propionimicrobium sp. BV2F7]